MTRRDDWTLQKRVDHFAWCLRVDRWFYRLPRYMRCDVGQGWTIASELASRRDCPPLFGHAVVREYLRQRGFAR